MKHFFLSLFLLVSLSACTQVDLKCYTYDSFQASDCYGCGIRTGHFAGLIVTVEGVKIALHKPIKVTYKGSQVYFEDAFSNKYNTSISRINQNVNTFVADCLKDGGISTYTAYNSEVDGEEGIVYIDTLGAVYIWDGSEYKTKETPASSAIIDSLSFWVLKQNMRNLEPSIIESQAGNKNTNIVIVGDSKTDQSIIMERSFKNILGKKFFFSGPGFYPINSGLDAFTGTINSTWTLKTMTTGGVGPNMYSLQSQAGSTAVNMYPYFASKSYYKYNKVTVIYLGKTGGGTFTLDLAGTNTSINTSLTTGIQTASVTLASVSNHTATITQTAFNTTGVEIVGVILENTLQKGVRVHKVGQGSATTTNYANQDSTSFVNQLKLFNPDSYFVWLGTNDKAQSITPTTYKANIKRIVRRLKATNNLVDICLIGVGVKEVPPWTEGSYTYDQYNDRLKEVAIEDTVAFFDLYKLMGTSFNKADQRGWFQSDGLHEDTLGGLMIANNILNSFSVVQGEKQSDLLLETQSNPVVHAQVFGYMDFGSRRLSSLETNFYVEGHTAPNITNGTSMMQFIGRNNTNNNGFYHRFEYVSNGSTSNAYEIKTIGTEIGLRMTADGATTLNGPLTTPRLTFTSGLETTNGLWSVSNVRFAATSSDLTSVFLGRGSGPSANAGFTGVRNVAVGSFTGSFLTSASRNVMIGWQNSEYATTSSGFVSIGCAGNRLTNNQGRDYSKSVAIGDSVLYSPNFNPLNKLVLENSPSNTPLLSGDFSTDKIGINVYQAAPRVTLDVVGTDGIIVPVGTTAQRPTAAIGTIRFNTTTSKFEGYDGTNWVDLH